jgi:hypothetical protein
MSRHASENAGILFNGTSTLAMEEFVKDNEPLTAPARTAENFFGFCPEKER